MSKIYREFEVQIPDEAKISYSDQRVYIITKKVYISERQYNEDRYRSAIAKTTLEKGQGQPYSSEISL